MLRKFAKLCSPVFSVEVRQDAVGRKQASLASLTASVGPLKVWLSLAPISNEGTGRPRFSLARS